MAIIISIFFLIINIASKEKNFCYALLLFLFFMPIGFIFPFYQNPMFTPLVITLIISIPFYKKKILSLVKLGNINGTKIWLSIIIISLASSISLVLWGICTNKLGIGIATIAEYKQHSLLLILIALPFVTILNAIVEEIIFRGIIQTEISYIFNNFMAIIFQAILFAGVHYSGGFPNGLLGYIMTFTYAIFLGVMRLKTKGILATIIIHTIADSTIFIFLLSYST
jgi:membrane protease YdiL (CAAX protease family)